MHQQQVYAIILSNNGGFIMKEKINSVDLYLSKLEAKKFKSIAECKFIEVMNTPISELEFPRHLNSCLNKERIEYIKDLILYDDEYLWKVRNLGNVVEVIIQGSDNKIADFIYKLQNELPPIAKINNLETEEIVSDESGEIEEYADFTIKESSDSFSGTSVIPPDLAICDKCLEEINDPNNRRYNYPFNACTDCGPRFTVIENVPYDRDKTTMDDFPLCNECEVEYKNPLDRRYHAEASCCEVCGPSLQLYKNDNQNPIEVDCEDPLMETAKLLDEGKIFAIKGIGGTHLVANVMLEDTVKLLRERLGRENQAFAVMSPDIETVKEYAIVSEAEEKTLLSKERPIVILKKTYCHIEKE